MKRRKNVCRSFSSAGCIAVAAVSLLSHIAAAETAAPKRMIGTASSSNGPLSKAIVWTAEDGGEPITPWQEGSNTCVYVIKSAKKLGESAFPDVPVVFALEKRINTNSGTLTFPDATVSRENVGPIAINAEGWLQLNGNWSIDPGAVLSLTSYASGNGNGTKSLYFLDEDSSLQGDETAQVMYTFSIYEKADRIYDKSGLIQPIFKVAGDVSRFKGFFNIADAPPDTVSEGIACTGRTRVLFASPSAFGDTDHHRSDALRLGNKAYLQLTEDVVQSDSRGITVVAGKRAGVIADEDEKWTLSAPVTSGSAESVFEKIGDGTVVLSGDQTGITNVLVSAGTLVLGENGAFSSALSVTVAAGARLVQRQHIEGMSVTVEEGGFRTVTCVVPYDAEKRLLLAAPAGSEISFTDEDLAVYYPLDRADRLCTDFSFHGNADLLSRGSPECVTDAKFGKALYLDGSSALTNGVFPATLPVGNEAWSICVHLRFDGSGFGGLKKYHPVGWGACSRSEANFLQLIAKNRFDHIIWSDTPLTGYLPNGDFTDGWHSMVVTYSPADNVRSMYFDGVLVASGPVNKDGASRTPKVAAKDFAVGGEHNNERDWKGWLDEVAVFRRPLTAEEVAGYHAGGVAGIVAKAVPSGVCDGLTAEEGAVLRIAQTLSVGVLAGSGTVETWGMTITDGVSGSPSAIGDVTLGDGVEFAVPSLPKDESLILMSVTGGELTLEGGVRLSVNGVDKTERCRFFVKNGVLYARYRRGLMLRVK